MRSADTHPEAQRVQVDLLRGTTVARRAALARSLSETALFLAHRAIARANPTADERDVAVRFVASCYGQTVADGLHRHFQALPR